MKWEYRKGVGFVQTRFTREEQRQGGRIWSFIFFVIFALGGIGRFRDGLVKNGFFDLFLAAISLFVFFKLKK